MKLSKKQLADKFDIDLFYPESKDNLKVEISDNCALSVWDDGECFIFRWGVEKDIMVDIKDNRQYIEVADALGILDKNEWL